MLMPPPPTPPPACGHLQGEGLGPGGGGGVPRRGGRERRPPGTREARRQPIVVAASGKGPDSLCYTRLEAEREVENMTGRQDLYDESMQLGHSAAWDLQWERAIGYYSKALAEFPEDPRGLTSLALALLETNQLKEALAIYRRAA